MTGLSCSSIPGPATTIADIFDRHGRDMGFDIPGRTDYVEALRPLLTRWAWSRT